MLQRFTLILAVVSLSRGRMLEQTPGWGRAAAEPGAAAQEDSQTPGWGSREEDIIQIHSLGLGAQEDEEEQTPAWGAAEDDEEGQTPGWGAAEEQSFALELTLQEEGDTIGFGDKAQEDQSLGLEMVL